MGRFGAVTAFVLFCFAGCNFRLLGATRFTEIELEADGRDKDGFSTIQISYNRLTGIDYANLPAGEWPFDRFSVLRPYAENLFPQIEGDNFDKVYIPSEDWLSQQDIGYSDGLLSSIRIRTPCSAIIPRNALFYKPADGKRKFLKKSRLIEYSSIMVESNFEYLENIEKLDAEDRITFRLHGNEYWFVTKSKLWRGNQAGIIWQQELTFEPLGFLWHESVVYLSALRSFDPDEKYIQLYEANMEYKTVKQVYQSSVVEISTEARLPVRFIEGKIYLTYVDKSHRVKSIIYDIKNLGNTRTVELIGDLRKTFGFNATRMISAFVFEKTTVMLECEHSGEYFVAQDCQEKIKGDLFFDPNVARHKDTARDSFFLPNAIYILERAIIFTKDLTDDNYLHQRSFERNHSFAYMHGRAYNSSHDMLLFTNPSSGALGHCCRSCDILHYIFAMGGTPFAVTTYGDEVFLSVEGKDFGQRIYRFTIHDLCSLKVDKKPFYETSEYNKVPYRIQYLAAAPHKDPITKKSTSLLYASGYTDAVTLLSAQSTEYPLEKSAVCGPIHMFYADGLDVGVLMATMTSPKVTAVLYQVHLKKEAHIALQLDDPYRAELDSNFIVGDGFLRIAKLETYGDPPATSFYTLDQRLYCSLGILTSIWLLVSSIMRHDAKVLES